MTVGGWAGIAIFFLLVLAITKPLGAYMARVFSRERTVIDVVARPNALPRTR